MLKVFCQILGFVVIVRIIVVFTYSCVSTIHVKLRGEKRFDKEIHAMKLQACSFLSLHSGLVTPW